MGMNIMRMKGRAKMMRTIKVTGKEKIAVKPDMIRLYVNKEELAMNMKILFADQQKIQSCSRNLFENLGFQEEKTFKNS